MGRVNILMRLKDLNSKDLKQGKGMGTSSYLLEYNSVGK